MAKLYCPDRVRLAQRDRGRQGQQTRFIRQFSRPKELASSLGDKARGTTYQGRGTLAAFIDVDVETVME